jgi:hypothetical protein
VDHIFDGVFQEHSEVVGAGVSRPARRPG